MNKEEINKIWEHLQERDVSQEAMNYIRMLEKICVKYIQLQTRWNSLKEWLEKQKEDSKNCKEWNSKNGFNVRDYERDIIGFDFVLGKMNELERGNNKCN